MAVTEDRLTEQRGASGSEGRILSITGPVIEVEFPLDSMPEIGYALTVERSLEAVCYGQDRPTTPP